MSLSSIWFLVGSKPRAYLCWACLTFACWVSGILGLLRFIVSSCSRLGFGWLWFWTFLFMKIVNFVTEEDIAWGLRIVVVNQRRSPYLLNTFKTYYPCLKNGFILRAIWNWSRRFFVFGWWLVVIFYWKSWMNVGMGRGFIIWGALKVFCSGWVMWDRII